MAYFSFFGCLFGRHDPVRHEVTWDGLTFVGHCRHCKTAIMRRGKGDWRKRDDVTSAEPSD